MRLADSLQQGTGLYTMQEAAIYARIPVSTVRAWVCGTSGHQPIRNKDADDGSRPYLDFVDFAELVAVRSLRFSYGITLLNIREAIRTAKKVYGIDRPFSQKQHKTYVLGKELVIQIEGDVHHTQISGKDKMQQGMTACLQPYMEDFVWDHQNILRTFIADRYAADVVSPIEIRMSPKICSGAPMVGKTGHTAETLWREAMAIGDMSKAASNYRVDLHEVAAACKYCDSLGLAA